MGRIVRSCVQSILKMVNSLIGMVGIAMILYAVWLIRKWQEEMGDLPFGDTDHPAPWFIYVFLGLGATLCVITCAGHIAAETVNGCCLYLYMGFIFLLLLLEGGAVAYFFVNREWEEDIPEDPSGGFNQVKDFVKSNLKICKWIGLSAVCVQGLSFLLAMVLKALGPHRYYDSDDEFDLTRALLLHNAGHPPSHYVTVGEPVYESRNGAWASRINGKGNR